MTVNFNNKKRVGLVSVLLSILFIVSIGLLGSYYLWFNVLGRIVELILWVYFIFIVVLYYLGGYYYVEVDLTSSKLDIKYYNLFPFGRQYKRIVLPVDKLKAIKIRNGLGFVGVGLIIYGRVRGRIAKYPNVGLSACSKEQVMQLKKYALQVSKK